MLEAVSPQCKSSEMDTVLWQRVIYTSRRRGLGACRGTLFCVCLAGKWKDPPIFIIYSPFNMYFLVLNLDNCWTLKILPLDTFTYGGIWFWWQAFFSGQKNLCNSFSFHFRLLLSAFLILLSPFAFRLLHSRLLHNSTLCGCSSFSSIHDTEFVKNPHYFHVLMKPGFD